MGLGVEKEQGQGVSPEGERNWEVWRTIEAGGKSVQVLERELEQKGIYFHKYARNMMYRPDFATLKAPEQISLVRLKVSDLGFNKFPPTLDQIYQKALDLGLEFCPPEVGPELRIQYDGPRSGERLYIGMKQIGLPDEEYFNELFPHVFVLERDKYNHRNDGIQLIGTLLTTSIPMQLDSEFVFCLRK